jgi:hypothetical protein
VEVYCVATSWRVHDRHGISRLTLKKILNHAECDVTAIYDRHSYDPEKRAALETWARRLEAVVNPDSCEVVARIQPCAERLPKAAVQ